MPERPLGSPNPSDGSAGRVMGIYDREYARQPSRGGRSPFGNGRGALARARGLSVNSWLIIINLLVFVGDVALSRMGVPVRQTTVMVAPEYVGEAIETSDLYIPTNPQRPQLGLARAEPATGDERRRAGAVLVRPLLDPDSRQAVGYRLYRVMRPLEAFGHFSTFQGFFRLEVWRLVTFQFLHSHDTIAHIFLNMFGLFVFGSIVEQFLGSKRYLAFYLMCGIGGGLAYLVLNLIGVLGIALPGALRVDLTMPLIGASAGVFGVIMACAYIAPESKVQLLIPPIPLKLKWLAYGYVALAAFNLFITRGANQGGDAAHLGGALAGWYFIRNNHLLKDFFDVFKRTKSPAGRKPRSKPGRPSSDEVDRILRKVSEKGLQSLTDAEKKKLRESGGHS